MNVEPGFGDVSQEIYQGNIRPSSGKARPSASNPPLFEFGEGAGELLEVSPEVGPIGEIEGELKTLGYAEQEAPKCTR